MTGPHLRLGIGVDSNAVISVAVQIAQRGVPGEWLEWAAVGSKDS